AVHRQEVRRLAARIRRPPCPRLVAVARALDLDDVRAQVSEQHRAVRAGQHAREVEDANARRRQHAALVRACDEAPARSARVARGRRAGGVAVQDALEDVRGYVVANDVSARDLQFTDGQWVRGKSLDTFLPVGELVPASDVPDPQALPIRAVLNGETLQDSSTANMIFGVGEIVSFVSQAITLAPGDLIITGTPAGVGAFR